METSRSDDSNNTFSVSTASSNKRRAYRTSRAHFYWVTREPGSFEWFKSVMDEVAEMDKKVMACHPSFPTVSLLISRCWLLMMMLDVVLMVPPRVS